MYKAALDLAPVRARARAAAPTQAQEQVLNHINPLALNCK